LPAVDLLEFTPEPAELAWTFGGAPPVRRVKPGTALRLWTEDAFAGSLRSTTDLASASLNMPFVNPQTGPFYVEGAEPGDTLALHFVELTPARSWGASATIPFFGGLTSTDRTATLQDPLPERTWIYEVDTASRTVGFQAQGSDSRSPCRWSRCWARSAWRRPLVRSGQRWCRTCSAATWTRRRCAQGRPAT
jgi:hypothetical protein